jgi:hypothetical protein
MGEIKPEDVERLIREGKLHFGDELEFAMHADLSEWTEPRKLIKLDTSKAGAQLYTLGGWYYAARFPRPDLRDGDPIYVRNHDDIKQTWVSVYFKEFGDNGLYPYSFRRNRWTENKRGMEYKNWRIPTREELQEAGLDPNWYEGRRGVRQTD